MIHQKHSLQASATWWNVGKILHAKKSCFKVVRTFSNPKFFLHQKGTAKYNHKGGPGSWVDASLVGNAAASLWFLPIYAWHRLG